METQAIFTTQNVESLEKTCKGISQILSEHVDGKLMQIQLEMLGGLIQRFLDNPIISNSGIIPNQQPLILHESKTIQ